MSENTLFIGIDSGKSNTKVSYLVGDEVKVFDFATTVVRAANQEQGSGYSVRYNGNDFVVGDTVSTNSIKDTELSKLNDNHKLCVLTGIANVIKELGLDPQQEYEVIHTINMPVGLYRDTKKRQEIVDFYSCPLNVITVDGVNYKFSTKATAYFEGLGTLFSNVKDYKDDAVLILDCGSLNVNVIQFMKMKPQGDKSKALDYGGSSLYTKIKNELYNKFEIKQFEEFQLFNLIDKNKSMYAHEVNQTIKDMIKAQVESIIKEVLELGININYINVHFTGGATRLYKPFIAEFLPQGNFKISDETTCCYENAKGSLKLLKK